MSSSILVLKEIHGSFGSPDLPLESDRIIRGHEQTDQNKTDRMRNIPDTGARSRYYNHRYQTGGSNHRLGILRDNIQLYIEMLNVNSINIVFVFNNNNNNNNKDLNNTC